MKNRLFTLILMMLFASMVSWGQNALMRATSSGTEKSTGYVKINPGIPPPSADMPAGMPGPVADETNASPDAPGAWAVTWNFNQQSGTYTAITGGSTFGTTSSDEQTYGPFDIGFTFSYNGTNYTQFSVATNGFIGMGGTVVTTATNPISAGTSNNIISVLGMNLAGQTGSEMRYQTTGASPNRVLTVQWSGFRRSGITSTDNFNFQIQLYETTNTIAFVYGAFAVNSGTNSNAQVGIRGASSSDYNNRSIGANQTWATSIAGTSNAANCRVRSAVYPASGQTYKWCTVPIKDFPYNEDFTATLNPNWSITHVTSGSTPSGCTASTNWAVGASISYPDLPYTLTPQNGDRLAWFDSYNACEGTQSRLQTVLFDFTSLANPSVEFYMAHDGEYINDDSINVQVSVNGGAWTTLYPAFLRFDASFATPGWTKHTQYLPAYGGMNNIRLAFLATGEFGNSMGIDNVTVKQGILHDVGTAGILAPTKLPPGQDYKWWTFNKNYAPTTETFDVDTKLQVNGSPVSTTTNTITSLAFNGRTTLSGSYSLSSYAAGSTFTILNQTKLATDQNTSNDILINTDHSCTKDTVYAWDDGTAEGAVGYNTGSGWLGQLYYLSVQDTVTSVTIGWGTIPGDLAGNSVEIYSVSGGVFSTKFADIVTGISLTSASANTTVTYKATTPVILPAGTYWIGVHQSVALSGTYILGTDQTGLSADSYMTGFAFYSSTGAAPWTDYVSSALYLINRVRPNFANIQGVFVADPTAFDANPVSSSEIDLTWTLNGNGNNVLVAWNTTNTFGTPANGTTYSAGNTLPGGNGTVLQYNNSTFFNHTGRTANTQYFYKAWSYNGSIYSGGTTANAWTFCAETPAPWSEGFEGTTFPPTCWLLSATSYEWARSTACSGYGTGAASAIADFYNIPASYSFALFSKPFNQGTMTAPALAFDYAYATYNGEVDELDIYYSTDGGNTFYLLDEMPGGASGILNTGGSVNTAAFVPTSSQWATRTLILPIGTNMVAFNAISAYGNDLYIDNVHFVEGLLHDVGVKKLEDRDVYNVGTVTPTAVVKNYGGNVETFTVTMTIGTYTSTKTVTGLGPAISDTVEFDPWAAVAGNYTMTVTTNLVGDLNAANNTLSKPVKVMVLNKQVYGYTTFSTTDNGPLTFNLNNPGTLTELVNEYPVTTYPAGGGWANSTWYASIYATAAPYNLVTFSTTTGARTVVGDMGVNINAMSYNKVNSTMYGAGYDGTNSLLYTINLTTGAASLIGTIGTQLIINMAINSAGVCYATDLSSDVLGTINLTTAAFTSIGSIGFNANYAQDMEFDRNSGELYMAAYGETGQLRWVNTTTGNTMLIGDFQDGDEVTGFAIPDDLTPPLTLDGTPADLTCNGGGNGSITTTVDGGVTPYGYLWSNSATTANLTGIAAGTYTVTVTDAASSTISGSWTVYQPPAIGLNATVTNTTCPNTSDGGIDLGVSGGTPGYTYAWSNFTTGQDITNVLPGTYDVTVTDANNCTAAGSWNVGYIDAVCNYEYLEGSVTTFECYDAHYTITVAGPGKTFTVVQPTGYVVLIAAQNILLEEGTKVELGAYLHAYISTTFCDGIPPPLPAVATGTEEWVTGVSHPSFTLYPNPTSGNFILAQKGDKICTNVKVEIYNMSGTQIMAEQITGQKQHEFSFSDLPYGMYFVRIMADDYVETIKVIKTR